MIVELFVVHPILYRAEVRDGTFLPGEHTFLHQSVQADKVRISRKNGGHLIRGIVTAAKAGGAQGQDLPVGLSGFRQPVHKIVGFL